jgi:predicted Ser/Thr protein kinase
LISLAKIPTSSVDSNQMATPSLEELAGRIPGIALTALIGRGGMGAVYRGQQTDLARDVAVKVLPQTLSNDPVFVERFRREAQALAKLDHPNIVRVFGSGVSDGLCYIVMEYIEGATLRQAMNAKAIDPQSALRIVPQICEALAYAHARGVVHRDIKPENILLGTGGRVKVVDFGLAKMSDGDVALTMLTATGARLGTLRYMAPEQLDGMNVDHRADVYSLGVVFYEMLTGQIPMGQFAMPSEKAGTDPRIDAVVMRTLSREPADRYQQISDVETELESISQSEGELSWDNHNASQGSWHGTHSSWGQWRPAGREWKSKSTLFGLPIVHIAYGHHPRTRKKLVAKGVVAIGDVAVGGIAIGGMGIGIVSLGGFAMGINALGGCAIGLQTAVGGLALGGVSLGGAAIGLVALGGGAVGWLAIGGGAIGKVAIGGGARGTYVLAGRGWSPPEFIESDWILTLSDDRMPWVATLAVCLMWLGPIMLVFLSAAVGMILSRIHGVAGKEMPSPVKRHFAISMITSTLLFVVIPPLLSYYQLHLLQRVVSKVYVTHLQTEVEAEVAAMRKEIEVSRDQDKVAGPATQ